ncbi:histidine kinase [Chloroflexota bacterium]
MALLTTITYYHFIRTFFNKPTGKMIYLGYAGFIGFTIYIFLGGMVTDSYVVDGAIINDLDATSYALSAFAAPFVFVAAFHLLRGLRRATNALERNKVGYMLLALSAWAVFAITNFIPALENYSVDHIGNIAMALIISYAILRYQLFDLRLLTRKTLAYTLLAIFLIGIYVGLSILGYALLENQPLYVILLFASGIAVLLVLLIRPLSFTIQKYVDHFFYRDTYRYRQTLLSFNSRMGNIINLGELADEMLPTIAKALGTPEVKLLLEDSSSGDFTTQFTYPEVKGSSKKELRLSPDNPIVAWIENETVPLELKRIDDIPKFMGLQEVERESMLNSNLNLLCSIKCRGNLIGIIAIAGKPSGVIYLQEDLELVRSVANQAGIIIENARMFDRLVNQQEQMEKVLAHAVFAQEEERERISADLHDSVAQWLAAASYGAQTVDALIQGNGDDKVKIELAKMEDTIDKSLKELRRIVVGLRPPILDELGLTHALQQSLKDLIEDGISYKFSQEGEQIRLSSSVEITVYRAIQEAINNIRKHSEATKVSLTMQYQADRLIVEIRDNGKGFDLSQTTDSAISIGHMGLLGMRQRAEILGGRIRIKTSEGSGTIITLNLPIQTPLEVS